MTANFRNFYAVHQCFLFAHFLAGYLPSIRFDCLVEQNKGLTGLWHKAAKIEKREDTLFESETSFFFFFSKKVPKRKPFVFLWNSHFHTNVFAYSTKVIAISKTQRGQRCYRLRLTTRNAIVNYLANFTTCLVSIFSVSSAS